MFLNLKRKKKDQLKFEVLRQKGAQFKTWERPRE
jgi:hypothetical protein